MNPGQESVDEYFAAHYPPCQKELDALKADLRLKVELLPATFLSIVYDTPTSVVKRDDVLALFDGISDA